MTTDSLHCSSFLPVLLLLTVHTCTTINRRRDPIRQPIVTFLRSSSWHSFFGRDEPRSAEDGGGESAAGQRSIGTA